MRIGYISYEHPLGIPGGGIGTYLGQIARLMANCGEKVEVFTCHPETSDSNAYEGYLLHRVQASSIPEFRQRVANVFANRHLVTPFDIIEAAEYGAEALQVKKRFPELPLVVKLHTPSYLTQALNATKISLASKARFLAGGLVKGKLVKPYWVYRKEDDAEYEQYCLADALCSPSESLALLVKETWPTKKEIAVIPNPFVPSHTFLQIPLAKYEGGKLLVNFVGRLEKRKGILELMKAIPIILGQNNNILFQFIGKSHPSPTAGMSMEGYLKDQLKEWKDHLRFFGPQHYDSLPQLLANSHVCIFPSLWENFPNVCLEAMAAGRGVIASKNGGMAEMISDGVHGLLVSPQEISSIAGAVLTLASKPELITRLGSAARTRVLNAYNEKVTAALVLNFYSSILIETKKDSRSEVTNSLPT